MRTNQTYGNFATVLLSTFGNLFLPMDRKTDLDLYLVDASIRLWL